MIVRNVTLSDGESSANGGGGAMVDEGTVVFENCQFRKNRGSRASSLLVDGIGTVTLKNTLIEAAESAPTVGVFGTGSLTVEHSTIWNPNGSAIEAVDGPEVVITNSILGSARVRLRPPGRVVIGRSVLTHELPAGVTGTDNLVAGVVLDEHYQPAAGTTVAARNVGYRPIR